MADKGDIRDDLNGGASMEELLTKWAQKSPLSSGRGVPDEVRIPGTPKAFRRDDIREDDLVRRGIIRQPQKRDRDGNLLSWKETDNVDTSMYNESWSERIDRVSREGAARIIAGDPDQVRNQLNFKVSRVEQAGDTEVRTYQFTAACPESVTEKFVTDSRRVRRLREKGTLDADPEFFKAGLNEMQFAIAQSVYHFEQKGWHICVEENIAWENKEKRQICFCPMCVSEVRQGQRAGWSDR